MRKQTEAQINNKKQLIIEASGDVFVRYGFARTTVGDIAKAAGLHRPVLYSLFPGGKEELFEAYLLARAQKAIEHYRTELRSLKTMRERVLFCALDWCTESFTLTANYPEASDSYDICYPAVRKTYVLLAHFYSDLIKDAFDQSSLTFSAEQFAELFVFSLRGVRRIPDTLEELQGVVGRQVDVFLAAVSVRS